MVTVVSTRDKTDPYVLIQVIRWNEDRYRRQIAEADIRSPKALRHMRTCRRLIGVLNDRGFPTQGLLRVRPN